MDRKRNLNTTIVRDIHRFIGALREHRIVVDKAVLFGSYATGKNTVDSDVDVAVVSSQFGKNTFREMSLLRRVALTINASLEPLPFSPSAFNDKYSALACEIKRHGRDILL